MLQWNRGHTDRIFPRKNEGTTQVTGTADTTAKDAETKAEWNDRCKEAFDKFVDDDILGNPDLVATKYPLMSAAWFFNKNGLWSICDKGADQGTVTAVTKRVNGGTIGLPDRIKHFNEYYNLLK